MHALIPTQSRAGVILAALLTLTACETVVASAQPVTTPPTVPETGEGIFFPPVTSTETPEIRFGVLAEIGPLQRQSFVDQINLATTGAERPIPLVAQAVGTNRTTLVLLNLEPESYLTPYIARAMLARMTSLARALPAVVELGVNEAFDIYNLGAVMGFDRIIVTDGRGFSHEAPLVAPETTAATSAN
ncbi:MAG: hypothetical protein AAFQ85_09265 [Pseudomonadota bacterium]